MSSLNPKILFIAFPFLFDLDYDGYNLSSQKVSELRKNFENQKTEELQKIQGESFIKYKASVDKASLELYKQPSVQYDTAPISKNTISPSYPDICKTAGVEGRVVVAFYIDKNGNLDKSSIKVINSVPCLDQACIDEIKKSKWNPAKKGNDSVGTYITKTFTFSLEQAN